jgi:hypothetical protein
MARIVNTDDPQSVLAWLHTYTNPADSHWLYLGRACQQVNTTEGKMPLNRMAYELLHDPVPPHTRIVSVCGVSGCVNPRHLRVSKTKHIKPVERRPGLDIERKK